MTTSEPVRFLCRATASRAVSSTDRFSSSGRTRPAERLRSSTSRSDTSSLSPAAREDVGCVAQRRQFQHEETGDLDRSVVQVGADPAQQGLVRAARIQPRLVGSLPQPRVLIGQGRRFDEPPLQGGALPSDHPAPPAHYEVEQGQHRECQDPDDDQRRAAGFGQFDLEGKRVLIDFADGDDAFDAAAVQRHIDLDQWRRSHSRGLLVEAESQAGYHFARRGAPQLVGLEFLTEEHVRPARRSACRPGARSSSPRHVFAA